MITLPAGTYYIGDPCYVFNRDQWDALGDQTGWFEETPVAAIHEYRMVAFGTAYGDGAYQDNLGREYPVDSGLIGIVPIEVVDPTKFRDNPFGHVVRFDEPFTCEAIGGQLRFGDVVIETDPEDEDEDE